ncbi:MAG: hypothetical protein LBP26_07240 [Clostridiales bacterium]|jgi:hypothetical protein|nr:hypothetical protein [Clostridiales bacterium]
MSGGKVSKRAVSLILVLTLFFGVVPVLGCTMDDSDLDEYWNVHYVMGETDQNLKVGVRVSGIREGKQTEQYMSLPKTIADESKIVLEGDITYFGVPGAVNPPSNTKSAVGSYMYRLEGMIIDADLVAWEGTGYVGLISSAPHLYDSGLYICEDFFYDAFNLRWMDFDGNISIDESEPPYFYISEIDLEMKHTGFYAMQVTMIYRNLPMREEYKKLEYYSKTIFSDEIYDGVIIKDSEFYGFLFDAVATEINIPEGATSIANDIFYGGLHEDSVVETYRLPTTITEIRAGNGLAKLKDLKTVYVSENTVIEDGAFPSSVNVVRY